jgi:hypothetical protein
LFGTGSTTFWTSFREKQYQNGKLVGDSGNPVVKSGNQIEGIPKVAGHSLLRL